MRKCYTIRAEGIQDGITGAHYIRCGCGYVFRGPRGTKAEASIAFQAHFNMPEVPSECYEAPDNKPDYDYYTAITEG